ncbi:MAG: hypothetical protein HY652_00245 [Acidobacteria bacterium]|nr:hypothetical protein [Acidobacteriota bacterium]
MTKQLISFLCVYAALTCPAWGQPRKRQEAATPPAGPADMQIEAELDRTAFWVGDPVEYRVRIAHPRDVQFVLDNLNKESLRLEPFRVLDLSFSDQPVGERSVLTLSLRVASFEIANPEPSIPAFNLYYFRKSARLGSSTEVPAELLTIPPAPIGFRSTLVGEGRAIRDWFRVLDIRQLAWLPTLLGNVFLAAVFLWVGVWTFRWVRARRIREAVVDRRVVGQKILQSLSSLSAIPLEDPGRVEEFYGRIAELLRRYTSEVSQRDGPALTPAQLEEALASSGEDSTRVGKLRDLVQFCDEVRYSGQGYERGQPRAEEILREAKSLFR